jgi:hypothetical protein
MRIEGCPVVVAPRWDDNDHTCTRVCDLEFTRWHRKHLWLRNRTIKHIRIVKSVYANVISYHDAAAALANV